MPKTVKEKVIADTIAGDHALSARRLFIVFSALARRNYRYSATKIKGNEGNTLLDRPEDEIVTVDCASLADAFVLLLNEVLEDENAERVEVFHAMTFATKEGSRCFDTNIVGNVRMPGGRWSDTSRCVFKYHYFVASGTQTRMYFDPCMFTTYSTMDEVMSWKLEEGGGKFNNIIRRVQSDPTRVLIRVPPSYTGTMPPGFNSGLIIFKKSDFKKDEYTALWGKRVRPSNWSVDKYESKAQAALSRVNKLLREKAGVSAAWN